MGEVNLFEIILNKIIKNFLGAFLIPYIVMVIIFVLDCIR